MRVAGKGCPEVGEEKHEDMGVLGSDWVTVVEDDALHADTRDPTKVLWWEKFISDELGRYVTIDLIVRLEAEEVVFEEIFDDELLGGTVPPQA